jgi:hypothetical protein
MSLSGEHEPKLPLKHTTQATLKVWCYGWALRAHERTVVYKKNFGSHGFNNQVTRLCSCASLHSIINPFGTAAVPQAKCLRTLS